MEAMDVNSTPEAAPPPSIGRVYVIDSGNCSVNTTPLFDWSNGPTQVAMDSLYFCKCLVALLGLIVNLISVRVFTSFKHRTLFISMIFYLSACEVCFNASGVAFELFYLLAVGTNGHVMPLGGPVSLAVALSYLLCQAVWIVYKASLILRNWIIVVIAWRRYRAIRASLNGHRGGAGSGRRSVRLSLLCLGGLAALLAAPRSLEVAYYLCAESRQLVRVAATGFASSRAYSPYPKIFFVATSPLPIVCLLVISFLMLCGLRNSEDAQLLRGGAGGGGGGGGGSGRRCDSVNRTVLVLCATFVLCELPILVAGVIKDADCGEHCLHMQVFMGIANILTSLDSLANFGVYFFSIRAFRHKLAPACASGTTPAAAAAAANAAAAAAAASGGSVAEARRRHQRVRSSGPATEWVSMKNM